MAVIQHTLLPHDLAMHQIMHRLTHKTVADERRPKQIIAINNDAVGGCKMIGSPWIIKSRKRPADGVNRRCSGRVGHLRSRIGRREIFVPREVMIDQHILVHRIGIVAAEPVAPVVHRVAILALASLGFDEPFIRANSEIAPADAQWLTALEGDNVAAAVSVGAVDPVIQAPEQTVNAMLLIPSFLCSLAGLFECQNLVAVDALYTYLDVLFMLQADSQHADWNELAEKCLIG